MKKEQTVDYNIKVAWHSISRMYNQYGQKFDITSSTGFVLLNIDVDKGTPATKIAPMMGLESRSLTRMLKSMESKNWIYRQKDPEDGRSVRIFLTELGKKKRDISRISVMEFNKKIANLISEENLNVFFNVMQTISQVAEDKKSINQFLTDIEVDNFKYNTNEASH
jgi:DNA-binding MarR family transcriptional regulator